MTHCTDLIYSARVDWSEVGTGLSSMFARLGAETVRQDVPLLADVH